MTIDARPTRFHIGLQRAGSTYVYDLLSSHPDVALARKGLGFFSNKYERGLDWYLAQFPRDGVRIDSSPNYFFRGEVVVPRIAQVLADASPRFLLILRNPIDYTASRFLLHSRTHGFRKRFGTVPKDLPTLVARHPEYLDESRYAALLDQYWFARFERRHFCVVLFEEFVRSRDTVAARIMEFFGLRPVALTATPSSRNATLRHPVLHAIKRALVARPRLRAAVRGNILVQRMYDRYLVARAPKLPPERRAWLRDLLADDVARLKVLLGDPLMVWPDFQ